MPDSQLVRANDLKTTPSVPPDFPEPGARQSVTILVVDDERTLRESCGTFLGSEGYRVQLCGRGKEALSLLIRRSFDIVLIDQYMSEVSGAKLLEACLAKNRDTIAIVMTGRPSVAGSLEILRAGAWDFLTKPFSATQLQILIGRATHSILVASETRESNAAAARDFGHSEKVQVLGRSPGFQRAIALAKQVARTDASVFITGESGTGKELIAQFIHHHSRRGSRAMVSLNCAALPESLLESEMFGHRKGSFTGAIRDKPGLLETANGGTMFLDEITLMSTSTQAKLLRVVQDGVVRRVGSEKVDSVVNVRFIVATNDDPLKATETGSLRLDLFYRLYVVPIGLPPLRERQEDIPLLANHFLRQYWSRHRDPGQPRPRLSDAAMGALCGYEWPGNVRELQNLFEHVVVLADPGATIEPHHLPFIGEDGKGASGAPILVGEPIEGVPYHTARERILADFERRYLTTVLHKAAGNMSKAARIAGVDRTTLYRLLDKQGMQRETIMVDTGSE